MTSSRPPRAPRDGEATLHVGDVVAGRYEVRGRLGRGGMGEVFEVRDRDGDELVALKTLHTGIADPRALRREFRALADVAHPNLVQLYDLFDDGGRTCLTMELVPGRHFLAEIGGDAIADTRVRSRSLDQTDTLDDLDAPAAAPAPVARVSSFDPALLRERATQLARALVALHARGLVHRDVKPSNVRITPQGRVVLLDFGLAAAAGAASDLAGTIAYIAPEQASGATTSGSADWYSYGVLLFEALTGELPWRGSPAEVLRRKRTEPAPQLAGRVDLPEPLAALVDELLVADPERRPSGDQVLDRIGARAQRRAERTRKEQAPIGREVELERLRELWQRVRAGDGAWVALEGPAGIGKTTLLSAFAREADSGALRGRCYEREAVAYKGIDQIVEALVARLDDGTRVHREAADLAHAFPAAQRLAPAELTQRFGGEVPSDMRGAALRVLFARLGEAGPALLVLDDIQWADRDCLALLAQALRPPALPGLMVLVAARPDAQAGWHELPLPFVRVRVDPLAPQAAVELAQSLLGRAVLSIDAAALARAGGGSPLEIVERVRAVLSRDGTGGGEARALLLARVGAAAPEVRALVELAAVAGAPVPRAALLRAAALGELDGALDDARRVGLLQQSRRAGRLRVEVAHDVLREAVFEALDPERRRTLAAALAASLDALGWEATHVAELQVLAGAAEAARRTAIRAAERMSAAGGHDAAAALWRKVATLSNGAERRAARRAAADALSLAGRGSEAAELYRALADDGGRERSTLLRRAAEELLRAGRFAEGVALVEEGLGAWGAAPVGNSIAMARGLALHAATRAGWLPQARDESPGALDELELRWAALAGRTLGRPGQFLYAAEQYLRCALRAGIAEHVCLAWSGECTLAGFMGSLAFAELSFDRARRALAGAGEELPRAAGVLGASSAFLRLSHGDWARAEALAIEATGIFARAPRLIWEQSTASVITTSARAHRGALGLLAREVRRDRERVSASGNLYAQEIMDSGFATLADLLADDAEHAAARLAEHDRRPTGVMTGWLRAVGHALLGAYGHAAASHRAMVDELLGDRLAQPLLRSPIVRGTLLWTRATLALTTGDLATARRDAQALGNIASSLSALAPLLDAQVALLAGDAFAARRLATSSLTALCANDMSLFAAAARWVIEPGAALRDALAAEGAVRPDAMARIFAPASAHRALAVRA